MDRINRIAWIATSVWLVFSAESAMAQNSGQALMLAGNAAFRAGDYTEARDAYRDALDAGYDSALLQYNLGVVYYRLGEYAEAELALEKACSDPGLAALATYNLGLTSLAAGWVDDARSRFEQVTATSTDSALIDLARRALDRMHETTLADPVAVRSTGTRDRTAASRRPNWSKPVPPIGDFYFVVAARYGMDDNIYRTPSAPYVDPSQTGLPTVTPIKQSGEFMPVDMLARYSIHAEDQSTEYVLAYRMNGDFYDSAYANANEVTQRFEIGADIALRGKHERTLETKFFGVTHDETNFDPDTGVGRDIAGQDISDRFSYHGAGMRSSYEHSIVRWAYGFDARIERRSYEDAPVVTRYDHDFYHLDLWTKRRFGEASALVFSLTSYRRDYDARRARDLAGVLSSANPALTYSYAAAEVGLEQSLSERLGLDVAYRRIERSDNFEGYADYSQNMLQVGLTYRPSRRMRIEFSATARSYDYPNAFAFNDPLGGQLAVDATNAEIDFEYGITSHISIWSDVLMRDESSTDPRINYTRNRAILGIKWRH